MLSRTLRSIHAPTHKAALLATDLVSLSRFSQTGRSTVENSAPLPSALFTSTSAAGLVSWLIGWITALSSPANPVTASTAPTQATDSRNRNARTRGPRDFTTPSSDCVIGIPHRP